MTDITASTPTSNDEMLRLATDIVSAYVQFNPLPAGQLAQTVNSSSGRFEPVCTCRDIPQESHPPSIRIITKESAATGGLQPRHVVDEAFPASACC